MTRTRSTYLAILAVLLSPMAANADLISISYDTGGGVLTAVFEGVLQADNDTFVVTGFSGTPQLDGVDILGLPFVGSLEDCLLAERSLEQGSGF